MNFTQKWPFWLSLFVHLLLLLSFSVVWIITPPPLKSPGLIIPSYAYQAPAPAVTKPEAAKKSLVMHNKIENTKAIPEKTTLQQPRTFTAIPAAKNVQGVHLIGDKKISNKLLEELGKALTAHLVYPKIAADFRVGGRVLVGLVLHPDGHITEVQLLQSSQATVLDNAALVAVNSAAPVSNVSQYLDKPKFIVVGVIFVKYY